MTTKNIANFRFRKDQRDILPMIRNYGVTKAGISRHMYRGQARIDGIKNKLISISMVEINGMITTVQFWI